MKTVFKVKLGFAAFAVGLIGAMAGTEGVTASETTEQLIASIGVAVTSLMLVYMGKLLINEEI